MVERQTRDLEVRVLNPGPGSHFSLEFKIILIYSGILNNINFMQNSQRKFSHY